MRRSTDISYVLTSRVVSSERSETWLPAQRPPGASPPPGDIFPTPSRPWRLCTTCPMSLSPFPGTHWTQPVLGGPPSAFPIPSWSGLGSDGASSGLTWVPWLPKWIQDCAAYTTNVLSPSSGDWKSRPECRRGWFLLRLWARVCRRPLSSLPCGWWFSASYAGRCSTVTSTFIFTWLSPSCVSTQISPFYNDASHVGLGAHLTLVWCPLNELHLQWPRSQIRSRSTVLRVRTSVWPICENESHSVVSDLCYSMDYTVHGILRARILEWEVFPFSRESSQPRDRTQVSCIAGRFFTSWATREALCIKLGH